MSSNPRTGLNHSAALNSLLETSLNTDPDTIHARTTYLSKGDRLFAQGEPGDSVYILVDGELSVRLAAETHLSPPATPPDRHAETEVSRLLPGAIVGEMSGMSRGVRSASVFATEDCTLKQVELTQFRHFLARDAKFNALISDMVYQRWRPSALNEILVKCFGSEDGALLESIHRQANWHHLCAGEVLFEQGDQSDHIFIVVSGRLRLDINKATVHRSDDSNHQHTQRHFGYVSAGETIGEFGLVTGDTRTATITATRESNLVSLSLATFNQLFDTHPAFSRSILKSIIERQLRADNSQKTASLNSYSLAVLGASATTDTAEFARQLAACWPGDRQLLVLDSEKFDQLFGQPGASQCNPLDPVHASVATCLSRLESQYQTLIYVTDSSATAWTERCLSQIDEVVLLAEPDAPDSLALTASALASIPTHLPRRLALWHRADVARPEGTRHWLDKLAVNAHHHVRRGDSTHMQRLARHLAGLAVCLVLSGGGARGVAHAGVYNAIEQLDIPIDAIGGTSAGAIATGTIAFGMTYETIISVLGERANPKALMDYTLPITSLLKSEKINETCQALFTDTRIEDLWIPSFYVSTNLTHSEQRIHQRGLLWRAVRASMSIPGVFTPVMEDGVLLVDGGVMNNFPIDVMSELTGSPHIIAVNLNPRRQHERRWDIDASVSGWKILGSGMNPFGQRVAAPTITKTMMRTVTAASDKAARESESLAALVINPAAKTGGMLDFSDYLSVADSGRDAAWTALRDWKTENGALFKN